MARGLEVLRAAIEEGRRVRLPGNDDADWIRWDPAAMRWMDAGGNEAVLIWRVFWTHDWEIESEASQVDLPFVEAVAAMDRGEVVARSHRQFRIGGVGYVTRCEHPEGFAGWEDHTFDYDDIHATDWRIVQTAAGKGVPPTFRDFMGWLRTWDGLDAAWKALYAAMDAAQTRWPAMFRQEDGHGSGTSGSNSGD